MLFKTKADCLQDATLAKFSGYTEAQVQPVVALMVDYLLEETMTHEALFKKYASKKFWKGKGLALDTYVPLLTVTPASIQSRKWAKEFSASLNVDGGVTLEDVPNSAMSQQ